MRILVDAHVLDEPHQGTRTYIKGLYSELVMLRPDIKFYFAAYKLENLKSEIGDFPNVSFLQFKRSRLLRLLWEIPFLIWKYKIEFAHFQYVSPPIKNCSHIVTTHDILFRDFKTLFPLKYRLINDFLFRVSAVRADILFSVSNYSRKRISFHYKIPMEMIGITPNGVVREFTTSEDVNSDVNEIKIKYNLNGFILYVSRIEPRKNHLILLRAFKELELWKQSYKLVFIGKKDFLFQDLYSFISDCPEDFKDSILHLENVSDRELLSFYKNARLFVYPSLAEGFGIPPIEAIAAGTPTLCSNTTAMSDFDFLEDDLFDPSDLTAVKEKMLRKLTTQDTPDRLNRLRKIVENKYSWRQAAESFNLSLENHRLNNGGF